jgi:hypothetical protein
MQVLVELPIDRARVVPVELSRGGGFAAGGQAGSPREVARVSLPSFELEKIRKKRVARWFASGTDRPLRPMAVALSGCVGRPTAGVS